MNNGPPFCRPVVGDLVGGFKDSFLYLAPAQMAMNPMIFFDNTNSANLSTSVPKVTGKIQGAGGDGTGVIKGVAESNASLVRAVLEKGLTMKPVLVKF